jgi:tRNA (guanine-N7-)-methyltransferase
MRLRNVKNARELVNNNINVVKTNPFTKEKKLHLEIGTGKGDFIIEMAKRNPDINFIGIEKYESVLIRALEKIDDNIENLKFMCFDANLIDKYFNGNVDKIYLNFSDPWPKKKHAKRRLTSPIFLNLYEKISSSSVNIQMKTDNKALFAYSLEMFNNNGYHFNRVSLDLPESDDNVSTEYEKKFRNKGININYLEATKKKF